MNHYLAISLHWRILYCNYITMQVPSNADYICLWQLPVHSMFCVMQSIPGLNKSDDRVARKWVWNWTTVFPLFSSLVVVGFNCFWTGSLLVGKLNRGYGLDDISKLLEIHNLCANILIHNNTNILCWCLNIPTSN